MTAIKKTCTSCRIELPLELFNKNKTGRYGVDSRCKRCHSLAGSRYSKRHPEKVRAATARYRAAKRRYEDPIKKRARNLFQYQVHAGRIKKPNHCEKCGASGKIEGHHRDYSKPLEVAWLCVACHANEHRKYPHQLEVSPV